MAPRKRPEPGHPQDAKNQQWLKRKPRPSHPRLRGHAFDADVLHGHINIGGKNGDEQQDQADARENLHLANRRQQPDAAQDLEDSADDDAEAGQGNHRRHDGQKKLRFIEVHDSGEEKQGRQQQTRDEACNQGQKLR